MQIVRYIISSLADGR